MSNDGSSSEQLASAKEAHQIFSIQIPEKLKKLQENPREGLEMSTRRFSYLTKNSMNRPKVDILTELAKEGHTTLYEQMEQAISECDDIQAKVLYMH